MTFIRQGKCMLNTKFILSKEISIQHYQYTCSFFIIQQIEISFPHITTEHQFLSLWCIVRNYFVNGTIFQNKITCQKVCPITSATLFETPLIPIRSQRYKHKRAEAFTYSA